ncbi:hypothetical protein TBLA_0B00240 [Henningerozyma blattae CBS 6284]|uniref:DNA-binding protein RAP1 n=1 Tax=Henningerozyma blattae (strain ATCC 34711 / CBS 6284 / DSM 70876 / NBRC 10599 / NRRL Y-10934 / UCD 77-7) TaxID=1071380 RepID=I2GXL7_HENB6|nr:hypothetical protein TBLA_0B00240 [Tetrapisispora blattae CBS 6284]CCH58869.1 hypothetical protein TBLA_0B00240 [Tetrapisispora blattae CBS 6284]
MSSQDYDTAPTTDGATQDIQVTLSDTVISSANEATTVNTNNESIENLTSTTTTSDTGTIGLESNKNSDKIGIFTGLSFYIPTEKTAYDSTLTIEQLKDSLINNNAIILNQLPSQDSVDSFVICPYNNTGISTLSPTYIKECINANTLLEKDQYLIPFSNATSTTASQSNLLTISDKVKSTPSTTSVYGSTRVLLSKPNLTSSSHSKASFTEEEDEFILDIVRKNPTRRTTHTLFDEIAHYVTNHTGNSIRHRYRVYLSKRLEYVYMVDSNGRLIKDPKTGDLIKTKTLPPSLKRKFTAQEDYQLAIALKKQFYKDISILANEQEQSSIPSFEDYRVGVRRGPVAREFFKTFADSNVTHTENAWRDRFRKFLIPYGIDNYIQYYESSITNGTTPEPMKNLTNRSKRSAQQRDNAFSLSTPQESKSNSIPGNFNNQAKRQRIYETLVSGAEVAAAAAAATANATANANANSTDFIDADTMNFISQIGESISKQEQANTISDDNIDIKSKIDEPDSNTDDDSDSSKDSQLDYSDKVAKSIRARFLKESETLPPILPSSIEFPPSIATTDLFLPTFFNLGSTEEFNNRLNDIITRSYEPTDAEQLVQILANELGIRKSFSTKILTCLSGDLMMFPRYFMHMFRDSVNPPGHLPGVWTEEDDELLRNGDPDDLEELRQKHGEGRIELRRKFIDRDLI